MVYRGTDSSDAPKSFTTNIRDRFFDSQTYPAQNPYESPLPAYPYQSGLEIEHAPPDYGTGRYGQATFHQHVYSTLGNGGSGGGGHKSKHSGLAKSALTLLAFLFFIQMLQSCLKEQMTSMNPTVMVMTAGTGRIRKTGTSAHGNILSEANKELNQNDHHEQEKIISSVSNNVDILMNDQGDIFYGPAPKISFKLDNSFSARNADTVLNNEET